MHFRFDNLSPSEFSELVRDLLSAQLGTPLAKFPDGPDGGIDLLRAGEGLQPEIIVQCKHYLKSGFSAFKRDLKVETERVARLNPQRYIVASSVDLTLKQKSEIVAMFCGFLKSVDDVLGLQDISLRIRQNPAVEQQHYKLWLGSTTLLRQLLHNGTSVWREQLRSRLEETKRVYVQTPAFAEALQILNTHRVLLIVGAPGVGKTTLANVVTAKCVSEGFEFREIIDLGEDIKDLPETGKVLLYFDDFLGHSVWRDTSSGSEKRLDALIRLVERDERFSLVLTTRTYLLEDAKKVSSAVELRLNRNHQVILEIGRMSRATRAKILYNHLYFYGVSRNHCKCLTDWKKLEKILSHANFNPRIIEAATKSVPGDIEPSGYAEYLHGLLDRPSNLYRSAINDRIGIEARDLLFVLHAVGSGASLERVYRVWKELRHMLDGKQENQESFKRKLKSLDDNLVRLVSLYSQTGQPPKDGLEFYNPGVGETTRDLLWEHDDRWHWLCETAEWGGELANLARCHGEARPMMSREKHEVKLPDIWYSRWFELARSSVFEEEWFTALGATLSLRVWDGMVPKLMQLIDLMRQGNDDRGWFSQDWNLLGERNISDTVLLALENHQWLKKQLEVELTTLTEYGWDADDASELYERLDRLGGVANSARSRLQEQGDYRLKNFIETVRGEESLIQEDDYEEADSLNQGLHLGRDDELSALERRVVRRKTGTYQRIVSPLVGDDPLTEEEVKALFLSLIA